MPGMDDDARAQVFRQAGPSQDISWTILAELCLVAPAERFDEVFDGAFVDVANSVTLDQGLMEERARINFSRQQQVQAATNQAIGQMQMQFATWQQMHAQQQQAFDAQLRAWQANSDAHHRAFRQRSQEQFYGSPAGSGGAGDFSEAIRGVNTYVDKYGHEVEMDVSAETVWQNEAGDIAGFDKGVNPGYGWTQLRQV